MRPVPASHAAEAPARTSDLHFLISSALGLPSAAAGLASRTRLREDVAEA